MISTLIALFVGSITNSITIVCSFIYILDGPISPNPPELIEYRLFGSMVIVGSCAVTLQFCPVIFGCATTGGSNTGSSGSASGGNGISPGAIADIVIGALIILILGLALALWIHRKSLRRNPPGMVVAAHPPPPQSPKPVGVAQVRPLVPTGGDAPEVVQYAGGPPGIPIYSAPQHATVVQTNGISMAGFEGDIVSGGGESLPQRAAPAYSPPLEVSGVGRAEMEVPRG